PTAWPSSGSTGFAVAVIACPNDAPARCGAKRLTAISAPARMQDPKLAAEALALLPPDIGASPLFSADLAPVPPPRRTWNTYAYAALWISMCHCIPTYLLAGDMIAKSHMTWWQCLLTIAVGTFIVLVPILLNAHPGTKYGVPFPVLARSSFGA